MSTRRERLQRLYDELAEIDKRSRFADIDRGIYDSAKDALKTWRAARVVTDEELAEPVREVDIEEVKRAAGRIARRMEAEMTQARRRAT